ncbi:MAG: glycosyltransferase family 2 protein [Prochlorotrichaceae cyanobacterium]|jgi:glycosyltransferase involved in cell wall biosynthesis
MPLISIIVPTYNSERFIVKTINSALEQTFSNFELIIVDDCSRDQTVSIVERIEDSRIRCFSHDVNIGIAANRNRGLAKATGQYVAFLDHDDLWLPDKLMMQLEALEQNPQASVAYSWVHRIDEDGHLIRQHAHPHYTGNIYKKLLITNFLVTASNPLIRMDCLENIGGFDESIYGADDWDLFLRLAEKYEFVLLKHYHIQYRIVAGSGISNYPKLEQGTLKVLDKAFSHTNPSLNSLKCHALGNFYLYLSFKAVEEFTTRQAGLTSIRYMLKSMHYTPYLWRQGDNLIKVLFKVALIILLPPPLARKIIDMSIRRYRDNR